MTATTLLLLVLIGGAGCWGWVFIADELHWRRTTTPIHHPITGGTDVSAPPTQH